MNNLFPKFKSSDKELDITYDYRCALFEKHIRNTPSGRVITEFFKDVPWAGKYNTINCAASHHFKDGRWMNDPAAMLEYMNFWCTEGSVRHYSFPIADSLEALCKVTGDYSVVKKHYPRLLEIHNEWNDHKNEKGMYFQTCNLDGMEFSISGDGVRPTINSYMYADKKALVSFAKYLGDKDTSEKLENEAEELKKLINEKLWSEDISMFGALSYDGEPKNVREQIGYIPWIYGIADKGKDSSFRYLFDEKCFLTPYGLRTADASHPDYRKPFNHECLWNGPIWPFASAQTLTALINYLHVEENPKVSGEEFMSLLLTYAYSHRDTDGTPYIDENMDPDTGIWLAREIMREWKRDGKDPTRGADYNHSTFIDLVITGICGICPSSDNKLIIDPLGVSLDFFSLSEVKYHGRDLSVTWDKSRGLTVIIDGENELFKKVGSDLRIEIIL